MRRVLLFILLLCIIGESFAETRIDIAETNLSIILPDDWCYYDRNADENNPAFDRLSISVDKGMRDLGNECCLHSFDSNNYSIMRLYRYFPLCKDFALLSENQIMEHYIDYYLSYTKQFGGELISAELLHFNLPFVKVVYTEYDTRYYEYYTVFYGREYRFGFTSDLHSGEEIDELFDSIIRSVEFCWTNARGNKKQVESYKCGVFSLLAHDKYVYALRNDKNKDNVDSTAFNIDYHLKARVSYGDLYAEIYSYSKEHNTALSENECLTEIKECTGSGFYSLSKRIKVDALGNNTYMLIGKDDVTDGVNVEYASVYVFHRDGIVKIQSYYSSDIVADHERFVAFLKDLASSILPLEEMPKNNELGVAGENNNTDEETAEQNLDEVKKQKNRVSTAESQLKRWVDEGKKTEDDINKLKENIEKEKEVLECLRIQYNLSEADLEGL